jgi:hypothetical protein
MAQVVKHLPSKFKYWKGTKKSVSYMGSMLPRLVTTPRLK